MSDQPTNVGNPSDDLYKYYDTPKDTGPSNLHQAAYGNPGEKVIHIDRNQVPPEGLNLIITNDNVNVNRPSDQCVPGVASGPDYSRYCQPYQEMPPPYYANPGAQAFVPGGPQAFNPAYGPQAWNPGYGPQAWNPGYGPQAWNPGYGPGAGNESGASPYQWAGLAANVGLDALALNQSGGHNDWRHNDWRHHDRDRHDWGRGWQPQPMAWNPGYGPQAFNPGYGPQVGNPGYGPGAGNESGASPYQWAGLAANVGLDALLLSQSGGQGWQPPRPWGGRRR